MIQRARRCCSRARSRAVSTSWSESMTEPWQNPRCPTIPAAPVPTAQFQGSGQALAARCGPESAAGAAAVDVTPAGALDELQPRPGPTHGDVWDEREPDLAGTVPAGADLLVCCGAHREAASSEDPEPTPATADVDDHRDPRRDRDARLQPAT